VFADLFLLMSNLVPPLGAVRELASCGLQYLVRSRIRADAERGKQPLDIARLTRRARRLI
jgi:hypothetical protein